MKYFINMLAFWLVVFSILVILAHKLHAQTPSPSPTPAYSPKWVKGFHMNQNHVPLPSTCYCNHAGAPINCPGFVVICVKAGGA